MPYTDRLAAVDEPAVLAAVPRRVVDLRGRPLLVRWYFAINTRLPVFREGLFGRGMIALSEEGRRRFDIFPELVADDLFLDSVFAPHEKIEVESATTIVAAPLRTRDLVRRLVRVRRGNAVMRTAGRTQTVAAEVRSANRLSWLTDVVIPHPWLAPEGIAYVGITLTAAVLARRRPRAVRSGAAMTQRAPPGHPSRDEGPHGGSPATEHLLSWHRRTTTRSRTGGRPVLDHGRSIRGDHRRDRGLAYQARISFDDGNSSESGSDYRPCSPPG